MAVGERRLAALRPPYLPSKARRHDWSRPCLWTIQVENYSQLWQNSRWTHPDRNLSPIQAEHVMGTQPHLAETGAFAAMGLTIL